MEALSDPKNGITALVIMLGLHLLLSVGKFVFKMFEKKGINTDTRITKIDLTLTQFDAAVRELRVQIGLLEIELKEVKQFKSHTNDLFTAIKIIAGPKWPKVKKALEDEKLPKA